MSLSKQQHTKCQCRCNTCEDVDAFDRGYLKTVPRASLGVVAGVVSGAAVTIILTLVWVLAVDAQTPAPRIVFVTPLLSAVMASTISLRFFSRQWKLRGVILWMLIPGLFSFLIAAYAWIVIATHIASVKVTSDLWELSPLLQNLNWAQLGRLTPFFGEHGGVVGTVSFAIAQLSIFVPLMIFGIIRRFRPYRCYNCGSRGPLQRDVSRTAIATAKQLRAHIERWDWASIKRLGPQKDNKWLRFDVFSCDWCGQGFALSVYRRLGWWTQRVIHKLAMTADDISTVSGPVPAGTPPTASFPNRNRGHAR